MELNYINNIFEQEKELMGSKSLLQFIYYTI